MSEYKRNVLHTINFFCILFYFKTNFDYVWYLILDIWFPDLFIWKELPGNKWKLKIHIIDNGILFDCFNLKKSHKRRFQVYVNVRYFFALNRDLIRSYYLTLYLMRIWNYYIHCSITWQCRILVFQDKINGGWNKNTIWLSDQM